MYHLAMDPPAEEDILDLDCGKWNEIMSGFLISADDDLDVFVTPARAVQPVAFRTAAAAS